MRRGAGKELVVKAQGQHGATGGKGRQKTCSTIFDLLAATKHKISIMSRREGSESKMSLRAPINAASPTAPTGTGIGRRPSVELGVARQPSAGRGGGLGG